MIVFSSFCAVHFVEQGASSSDELIVVLASCAVQDLQPIVDWQADVAEHLVSLLFLLPEAVYKQLFSCTPFDWSAAASASHLCMLVS